MLARKMSDDLEQVAAFEDEASAEVLAGFLRNEGIPAEVRPISPLPGLINEVQVFVPSSLAHRARWFMNSPKVTEAELNYAATGDLTSKEDDNL